MKRVLYPKGIHIAASASVVGFEEFRGPLGALFDEHDDTDRFGADTWEKAEGEMSRRALALALRKNGSKANEIELLFAGDLQNQCVASAYGLLPYGIPYVGLYGACSTCTEGLFLAAMLLDGGGVERCAAVTSSHNCAAERQFRLPLEYGGQRTPTAQWTATAAGAFLLDRAPLCEGVRITAAMAGVMVDGGVRDAANMGAAMAPAAADSIRTFLGETHTSPSDYDAIVTGDLGREGGRLLLELLEEDGIMLGERHRDCGSMMYDPKTQDAHAGGSGCGCSAAILSAYFLPRLARGELHRILFLSTGALMSPSSIAQGESIYGVAPVVCLEC